MRRSCERCFSHNGRRKVCFLIFSQQVVSQATHSGTEAKEKHNSFLGGPGDVVFLVLPRQVKRWPYPQPKKPHPKTGRKSCLLSSGVRNSNFVTPSEKVGLFVPGADFCNPRGFFPLIERGNAFAEQIGWPRSEKNSRGMQNWISVRNV